MDVKPSGDEDHKFEQCTSKHKKASEEKYFV